MKSLNYLWRIPDNYPQNLIGQYQTDSSPDRFLFSRGESLPHQNQIPQIRFDGYSEQLKDYDVLPNSSMVPLVSTRIALWLKENCVNDVQLVESQVNTIDGPISGYVLVNILTFIKALDQDQSQVVYIPNTKQILKFNRLRLTLNCLGTHCIARMAEYSPFILVSDFLKDEFAARSFKGCSFILPETLSG